MSSIFVPILLANMPVSVYAGWNLAPPRAVERVAMNELLPDIYVIKERGALGAFKPEINIYVLAGHDGLVFDAGYGNSAAVRHLVRELGAIGQRFRLQGRPFSVRRVLVSHAHPDHFPGLGALRAELGLRILLSARTAGAIRSVENFYGSFDADDEADFLARRGPVGRVRGSIRKALFHRFYRRLYGLNFVSDPDELLPDTAELSINGELWQVFPSPGHASDHISLYSPRRGVLFSGDNVLRSVTTWLGPPNSDLEAYIDSLERMLDLPKLEVVLPSHGSPVTNPRERIREIIDFRRRRTLEVYEVLRAHNEGANIDQVIRALYAGEGRFKHKMARGWVALTLRFLESKGLAERTETRREIRFHAATGASVSDIYGRPKNPFFSGGVKKNLRSGAGRKRP